MTTTSEAINESIQALSQFAGKIIVLWAGIGKREQFSTQMQITGFLHPLESQGLYMLRNSDSVAYFKPNEVVHKGGNIFELVLSEGNSTYKEALQIAFKALYEYCGKEKSGTWIADNDEVAQAVEYIENVMQLPAVQKKTKIPYMRKNKVDMLIELALTHACTYWISYYTVIKDEFKGAQNEFGVVSKGGVLQLHVPDIGKIMILDLEKFRNAEDQYFDLYQVPFDPDNAASTDVDELIQLAVFNQVRFKTK